MSYQNAKDLLPKELFKQIQEYVQGQLIYIPQKKDQRASWGTKNGTRKTIYQRNEKIYELYQEGYEIITIMKLYHLSEASIRKIITKMQRRYEDHKKE